MKYDSSNTKQFNTVGFEFAWRFLLYGGCRRNLDEKGYPWKAEDSALNLRALKSRKILGD